MAGVVHDADVAEGTADGGETSFQLDLERLTSLLSENPQHTQGNVQIGDPLPPWFSMAQFSNNPAPTTSQLQRIPPSFHLLNTNNTNLNSDSQSRPKPTNDFDDFVNVMNHFAAQPYLDENTAQPLSAHDALAPPFLNQPLPSPPSPSPSDPSDAQDPEAEPEIEFLRPQLKRRVNSRRIHRCTQKDCKKSFTRKYDLDRHIRSHTGERPFPCSYENCGKSFIQRSALLNHLHVHTGEKPYECEYPTCDMSFGDSSSLARHRRTHTGKKPYHCEHPQCSKTFSRRGTLTSHMRTHDANWEPDPNVRYDFKSKKPKLDEELEDSVRSISALFQPGAGGSGLSAESLQTTVAKISTDIAAAILNPDLEVSDDDDDDDDNESGGEQQMVDPSLEFGGLNFGFLPPLAPPSTAAGKKRKR